MALTGTDPDRLKEEKLRGITIDLGFAHLDMGDVQLGFVDVPGHERFVKNMLAGVGGIDLVLLVVAADESIMPQTREHFDICRLLGIRAGIIVVTKIDTVEKELVGLVEDEIRETVAGSFLEGARIVPVSVKTGDGIAELKGALHGIALGVAPRPADRLLRLPVDRAFTIKGFGTVVTGTLTSGELLRDQEVELIPGGPTARVRGIQVHGRQSDNAIAGQRTAINLQGVELTQVRRGMVLTLPGRFHPTRLIDVRLDMLGSARPLRNLRKVRFHHGTAEVLARVALLGRDILEPSGSGYAQLRLDSPIFCLHGDAFIVRQFSPTITIGGGRVLNPQPAKHRSSDARALEALRLLDRAGMQQKVPVLIETHPSQACDLDELNSLIGLPPSGLRELCSELSRAGKLVLVPGPKLIVLHPSLAERLANETVAQVSRFHENNPLLKGISREELRKKLFSELPPEVFRFSLDRLVGARRISLLEETVSLFGREVQLTAGGQELRARIEARYRQAGYQPPQFSDLTAELQSDPEEVKKIYFWMLKERILIRIADDMAYHRETLEEIRKTVRASFAPGQRFGVAEFKDLFALTRKHAIPLLEYLDRERFTRRQGNDRVLL
jgi:selenocysteine-specific elongation factor